MRYKLGMLEKSELMDNLFNSLSLGSGIFFVLISPFLSIASVPTLTWIPQHPLFFISSHVTTSSFHSATEKRT